MVIRIYWASVSGNRKVNSDQNRLKNLVESLKFETTWIDITTDPIIKEQMRRECGKPTAMPPQIFNEDIYLGTVDDINESVEGGYVLQWLKLAEKGEIQTATDSGNASEENDAENCQEKEVADKEIIEPPPQIVTKQVTLSLPGKLSTGIMSTFENNGTEEVVERKAVSISISELKGEDQNNTKKNAIDEARKRKLLGLPEVEVSKSNGNGAIETNEYLTPSIKTFEEINKASIDCSS